MSAVYLPSKVINTWKIKRSDDIIVIWIIEFVNNTISIQYTNS